MIPVLLAYLAAASPLPVQINSLPRIEVLDSGWVIFAALASTAVAGFTGWLAWQTRGLAKETKRVADETAKLSKETLDSIGVAREAIAAEDRRHADEFMPHIAILAERVVRAYPDQPGIIQPWLVVSAKNIGSGLAWQIEAQHSNTNNEFIVVSPLRTALGVSEEVELIRRGSQAHVDLQPYVLVYEDTFGRRFESSIPSPMVVGSKYTWRRL